MLPTQPESCDICIKAIAMYDTAFLPYIVTAECSAVCGYSVTQTSFLKRYKYTLVDLLESSSFKRE